MRQEGMNTYLNTNKLQLRELEAKVIMIVIDDQFAGLINSRRGVPDSVSLVV